MEQKDFPVLLTADEISQILKCSKRVAYEIMDQKDFPLIRIRRSKRVNRDDFFTWLDKQSNKEVS
ncbi:helix-turn-helix domain-containing protein [Heyndrickxia camelliae]|uniref:DNA-binding protein n=1 Tax=Heyndrickxia camelliae TaxID=1707093 RepID=A0A2N3LKI6_9BACI|nr:helix-turn-helix domain-containing protein [Heyndrickxia camelliae]PKR85054.1 DNA-binding protein [Heyndrickxia camelliae]